jgi:hypothetical protein
MTTTPDALSAESLAVKRIGSAIWIMRLLEPLGCGGASALRDAFSEAIERDASDIVVDLGTQPVVSVEEAATLVAMAAHMRARDRALWVAAGWSEGTGYTLRLIRDSGPAGLLGLSPALDSALHALDSAIGGESGVALTSRSQRATA